MKHIYSLLALSISLMGFTGTQYLQIGNQLAGAEALRGTSQGRSVSTSADGNTAILEGGGQDTSEVGAAWIFTRSGGIWTPEGSTFVGTGAVGQSAQGSAISISVDGNTATVGGINDGSTAGAGWFFTNVGGV